MKDNQLTLLKSPPARTSNHLKCRCYELHGFKRPILLDLTKPDFLFPPVPSTQYICAIKPEQMSKTYRAYHEVESLQRTIKPDRESKVAAARENKEGVTGKKVKPAILNEGKDPPLGDDDGSSFCICNRPYVRGDLMFKCEGYCSNWYHPKCLGMHDIEIDRHCKTKERWYCNECYERAHTLLLTCGPNKPESRKSKLK